MNRKNPGEVIQSCRAHFNQWDDLLAHTILCRKLIRGGVHPGELCGYLNTKIFCKRNTHHAIACIDLMTETHRLDLAMAVDRVANADHWIGKVDKPCLRTEGLHVAHNFHDWSNIACCMCKSAGSTVFGIRLTHSIFDGNFKI